MDDLCETIRKVTYGALFGLALVAILSLSGCDKQPAQIACTMEAKLCPDGVTYVGRTGPNCEFAACPVQDCSGGCPQYMPPAPGWCSDGKIVDRGKNACGCQLPPDCQIAEPVACTEEAAACPGSDGIYVGRTAPYCLFEACPAPTDKCNASFGGTGAYMPNPASVYCVDIGGESIIRTAEDGSQYGVCRWNSIEFEEWDLFRKNCQ